MRISGKIVSNFEDYFHDYMNLQIEDLEVFSKTLNKIKEKLKLKNFKLNDDFLLILNEIIDFNNNLIVLKIIDNI